VPTTRLEITVTDDPAVLDRIVSSCRSRQCTITSLHYEAGDRHRPGFVSLTMDAAAARAQLAAERVARLVDVLAVEQAPEPGRPPRHPTPEAWRRAAPSGGPRRGPARHPEDAPGRMSTTSG
jgi:acetolactate synthase regulatory subunit